MANLAVIAVVGLILGLAAGHIYKEKKRGKVCVGCPYGGCCASQGKNGSCGCNSSSAR